MKLNLETMVYDDIYNVKYVQLHTLNEPAVFKNHSQSCYVQGDKFYWLCSFEKYIKWLERPPTDTVRNPNHKFMESNMSTIIHRMSWIGVGVSDYTKIYHQFHTMILPTHLENLYLKELFQSVHSRFLDALDLLWNHPVSVVKVKQLPQKPLLVKTVHKRNVLSGIGEIVMFNFGGGCSGGSRHGTSE